MLQNLESNGSNNMAPLEKFESLQCYPRLSLAHCKGFFRVFLLQFINFSFKKQEVYT